MITSYKLLKENYKLFLFDFLGGGNLGPGANAPFSP
jgi:hypothetical protein